MIKRKILFLLAFVTIAVSGCSQNAFKQEESTEQGESVKKEKRTDDKNMDKHETTSDVALDNNYSVKSEEKTINGFILQIPQVDFENNESKQAAINKLIIENINEYFDKICLCLLEGDEDQSQSSVELEYSIETKTNDTLSILFTMLCTSRSAAHPSNIAFAINLDMKEVKVVELNEVKNRIRKFDKTTFTHVVKRELGPSDDGGVLEGKDIEDLLKEMDNHSFYFIENKIGVIFDVIYACGGYSIYEEN